MDNETKLKIIKLKEVYSLSFAEISRTLGIPETTVKDFCYKKTWKDWWSEYKDGDENLVTVNGPKILTLDIETAPILGNVWALFKQNIGLNQIERDWYILSWSAKWLHEDQVMYQDKRESFDTEDDQELLRDLWHLIDEADIIVTQNGKKFDEKKLNARFLINGFNPPSSSRHIDTYQIASRHFGFTSKRLAYMTEKLCKKYKKLDHENFSGFELWKQCLAGNIAAWNEMQEYNIHDVLATEELYLILRPWFRAHPNTAIYYDNIEPMCNKCQSTNLTEDGYHYTNLSKFLRWRCEDCGAEVRDRTNLIPKEQRQFVKANVV